MVHVAAEVRRGGLVEAVVVPVLVRGMRVVLVQGLRTVPVELVHLGRGCYSLHQAIDR